MVAKKNNANKDLLKKLKVRLQKLEKKEAQSRHRLRMFVKNLQRQSVIYKKKLAAHMKVLQSKINAAHADGYAKVAFDLEHQILKGIQAKAKALASALGRLDKKQLAQIKKSMPKAKRKKNKTKRAGSMPKKSKRSTTAKVRLK